MHLIIFKFLVWSNVKCYIVGSTTGIQHGRQYASFVETSFNWFSMWSKILMQRQEIRIYS